MTSSAAADAAAASTSAITTARTIDLALTVNLRVVDALVISAAHVRLMNAA
jgi:hypothetical protein